MTGISHTLYSCGHHEAGRAGQLGGHSCPKLVFRICDGGWSFGKPSILFWDEIWVGMKGVARFVYFMPHEGRIICGIVKYERVFTVKLYKPYHQ